MTEPPGASSRDGAPGRLSGAILDGRYRVGHLLGQGGMSEVYLGHHLALDRPCAIKVVHPDRAANAEALARFTREASAASRITHPHVCQTHDFGSTPDGLQYLVLEYLEGRPLSQVLAAGPLTLPRALEIFRQCGAGLQACHDAGVVHRDLKADNVMLVPRGGADVAVLMDFGIARALAAPELTRDGLMVGTPEVMSPEQIAGDPVGPASDQYQLALLLVRMVTGKLPFPGETTQERMTRRLSVPPVPLSDLAPELAVPAAVQAAITRALALRPADRFPTVHEFVRAADPRVPGAPEPDTEILPRGGGSSPTRLPLLARVVIGVAALAGIGMAWQVFRPRPPVSAPPTVAGMPGDTLTVADPTPPGTPAPLPPPVQPGPVALPSLPAESLVFSPDRVDRRGAREQAQRVYRSDQAPDTLRALAAYLIAETHRRDGAFAEAREWLQQCLALQERAICRQLLLLLP